MPYELRAQSVPGLFRTELTANGQKKGEGFQRSFGSKWFAFYHHKTMRWLRADKSDNVLTLNKTKPGAWEKFEIEQYNS